MQGQTLDVTELVLSGNNSLTIWVTNTNINRVSAFTEPVPVPEELTGRFGKATAERLPREFGFDALPASGLLGPVKIIPYKEVSIIYN